MQLTIVVGKRGSGKTTWVQSWLPRGPQSVVVTSNDVDVRYYEVAATLDEALLLHPDVLVLEDPVPLDPRCDTIEHVVVITQQMKDIKPSDRQRIMQLHHTCGPKCSCGYEKLHAAGRV